MRSNTPRQLCYATTALAPELQPRFDACAQISMAGLAAVLRVSVTVVESLMFGGRSKASTVAKVESAFRAHLNEKRSA